MKHDSLVGMKYQDFSYPGGLEDTEGPLFPTGGYCHIKATGGLDSGTNTSIWAPRHICHLALARATQAAGSHHGEGKGTKPCGPMAMMEEKRPLGCSEPLQQPADGWRANGM